MCNTTTFGFFDWMKSKKHQAASIKTHEKIWCLSMLCPSSECSTSQGRSITHSSPTLWHPKALSDGRLAPPGLMVWTRCCDDKTFLAAIREQSEQSSISLSSNPRSSIDFTRMRNGRQEKAQSDMPMGPLCMCVCVSTGDELEPRQSTWISVNTLAIHSLYAYKMVK